MTNRIKEIIDELNVTITYSADLEKPAHYITQLNIIVVNSNLSEYDQLKAILHELGHASIHQGNQILYNATVTMRWKMEYEAEEFATRMLFEDYVTSWNSEPRDMNYIKFIEDNDLDLNWEGKVKEWFTDYVNETIFG